MSDKVCWHCGAPLPAFDRDKIPFRETCETCHFDLHVCKNCKFWQPGRSNECQIPGTEFVKDRERMNFCEDFQLLGKKGPEGPSKDDIAKSLFKD